MYPYSCIFPGIFLESIFEKLLIVVVPRHGEREMGNGGKENDSCCMKTIFFNLVFLSM